MNYLSRLIIILLLAGSGSCGAPASETDDRTSPSSYQLHYSIAPKPGDGLVAVEMAVKQSRGQLRGVVFKAPENRISELSGDGDLSIENGTATWNPPASGGKLKWLVKVSHQRGDGGFDALLKETWGIFRAEDVIPRAQTRTLKNTFSKTTMSFALPARWSAVSEYPSNESRIPVDNPDRRFDQPSGWIAMGELGVRRETIAGTRVAIVAPEDQGVRRMDMLALLNWVLPEVNQVLPDMLPRLTVISANDPMWRGGLSAPASIFIHADRPLISENATSTLVHEVMHVALGLSAKRGFDWIVEGIAEYYSLELLKRGGAITARRYARALEDQQEWAEQASSLCSSRSSGAQTALAVVTFRRLDKEIRQRSAGKLSLDDVIAQLAQASQQVTLSALNSIVTELLQGPSKVLIMSDLPGCSD